MTNFSPSAMLSFDLETTSANPFEARIVTSALVKITSAGAETTEMLADPGVEIPAEATEVHGISTEKARAEGRDHDEVLAETIARIRAGWEEGLTLVVFNAPFDLSVLRQLDNDFVVTGPVFDPYVVDRIKDRYRKGKRTLSSMCENYGVRLDNAHEASADALAAARIAWKMANVWPELSQMDSDALMEMQTVGFYERQSDFRRYLEGQGKDPSTVNTSWPMQNERS